MLSTLDDLYLLMCSDCGGTMTAPSAKINEMNCSVPSCPEEGAAKGWDVSPAPDERKSSASTSPPPPRAVPARPNRRSVVATLPELLDNTYLTPPTAEVGLVPLDPFSLSFFTRISRLGHVR